MPNGCFWCGLIAAMTLACEAAFANRLDVLRLDDQFPGTDPVFVEAVNSSLQGQGFAVKRVSAEALLTELAAKPAGARLLCLPHSACFPVDARPALLAYLKAGGNLLAIGGPPLSRQVIKVDGQWLTEPMFIDKLTSMPPNHSLIDFGKLHLDKVERVTGTPETKPELHIVQTGIPQAPAALEIQIPSAKLWEFHNIPINKA